MTTFVITTLGLSFTIATMLPSLPPGPWPWLSTDIVLVGACAILVVFFAIYLTIEQKQIERWNLHIRQVQEETLESARRRLYALFEISRVMGMQSSPQELFDCITRHSVLSFNCDQASLMIFDQKRQILVVRSASGHEDISRVLGREQRVGEGIAGWVAKHQKPLIIGSDKMPIPGIKLSNSSLLATLVVPIMLREELVGVINISSRSPEVSYDDEDQRALQAFADNAGACIRNTERAQWMRSTIESLREQVARSGSTQPAGSPSNEGPGA